jgi:hypothetical protein
MQLEILNRVQNDNFHASTANTVMPNPELVIPNLVRDLFMAGLFQHLVEIIWFFIPVGISYMNMLKL